MRKILFLLFISIALSATAQQPDKPGSAEIYKDIQRLNFLGNVLYLGAHPDDENTNLISYLTNNLNARTAYLSLTRGDGGQNLIGPELREQLGLIRTQELLAARSIDAGEQYFSRANDFGYSKHPKETLQIWDKDEVLRDIVWIIRRFRPDIIINRFHHESHGDTHGHHTSSAILSLEAFEIAGNPDTYPGQLEITEPWQPQKAFFNTSTWFYGSQEAFEKANKSDHIKLDLGTYYPLVGMSNPEIAALSRSEHQSQGFGATGTRGSKPEFLELIAGEHPNNATNLFEGINTTWSRVEGGKAIGEILLEVESNFNFRNPAASIPSLLEAYKLIVRLEDKHWRVQKTAEIKDIIAACSGLFYEAISNTPTSIPGETVSLQLEVINRSQFPVSLTSVEIQPQNKQLSVNDDLSYNHQWTQRLSVKIPESADYTSPYWLKERGTNGMYSVKDQNLIGLPQAPAEFKALYNFDFNGVSLSYSRPIAYKRNDPVKGESYRPFEVIPPVSVTFSNPVVMFSSENERKIEVEVTAAKNGLQGVLKLNHPPNWEILPAAYEFDIAQKGSTKRFTFAISPPAEQEIGIIEPAVQLKGDQQRTYSSQTTEIQYEHIPRQTLVSASMLKVVKLDVQTKGKHIGYIHGAGDAVPKGLREMGYQVDVLSLASITPLQLSQYDAVILGIRAFNVLPELSYKQKDLFQYVHNGGNLIVQYNTSGGLLTQEIAPFPLRLSRDRVADETAEVRFLEKNHRVLNFPNKINPSDFENWVQERGLYFADQWSSEFTPILSMNDPGESQKLGSLLVAPYGQGNYIYTGLSFFREFPEGVPGAFRLFANLIAL